MNHYLTHSDFMESKNCNHMKGWEELNSIRADLSEKETVSLTSIFKGTAQMFLKGGKTLRNLFDEEDVITEISEVEDIVNDACESIITKDLEKAAENDKKELCMGIRRYMRFEEERGRRDSDDWIIMFNKQLTVTKDFFPLLEDVIPQAKGTDGINVFFDVVFINKKDKMIEGVKYKGGEAWLSSAATATRKTEEDKWTNIMLKALETLVPQDETYVVKTSYYHLRPKQVQREQGNWEYIPFDKNSSIISLEEEFCNSKAFKAAPTALDNIIKESFIAFDEGKDCDEADCKNCILSCSCHFIKTPEEMEEREKKKGKKPDPSEAQKKVIDWESGALSVIAGAGAGKTECSSEHMKELILKEARLYMKEHEEADLQTAVKEVLPYFFMSTFTNAGVIEMKERMIGKLENEGITVEMDDLQIMTFNTFAYNIDKVYYEELGFLKEPVVIDDIRNKKIIVNLLNENTVSGLNYESALADMPTCRGAVAVVAKAFEIIKKQQIVVGSVDDEIKLNKALGYGYLKFMTGSTTTREILDLYDLYEKELLEEGLITFADQEPMALRMLDEHPDYLENLGYKHIVIDEFQDSNDIQMEFVKRLCSTKSYQSLVVVGDDFQAIYGFRDTSPENMIHFPEKFEKEVTQHFLTDNYRSTPEVIDVSNQFIKNNVEQIPKDLTAYRESGKPVVVRGFYDREEEYDYILETVQKKLEEGYLPEDICIITGTNDEITKIGAKLTEAEIPVVMKNPQKYSANSRVKAAIKLANAVWEPDVTENYLPYLVAKYNGELLKEYTPEEIMEMIEQMRDNFRGFENFEYGYQRKLFHDFLEEIKGNDEIFESFIDMLNVCEDFPSELDFMQDFKKYGYNAAVRMNQMYQGVVLVTAHSSKGLEWRVVINTLDTYDSATLHNNTKSKYVMSQIEEKRRLVYVSMTRARDELYVIGKYNVAEEASSQGIVIPAIQNRFLKEVFDILDADNYVPVDPNREYKKQLKKEAAQKAKEERERRKKMRQHQSLLAQYKGDVKAMKKAELNKKNKSKAAPKKSPKKAV